MRHGIDKIRPNLIRSHFNPSTRVRQHQRRRYRRLPHATVRSRDDQHLHRDPPSPSSLSPPASLVVLRRDRRSPRSTLPPQSSRSRASASHVTRFIHSRTHSFVRCISFHSIHSPLGSRDRTIGTIGTARARSWARACALYGPKHHFVKRVYDRRPHTYTVFSLSDDRSIGRSLAPSPGRVQAAASRTSRARDRRETLAREVCPTAMLAWTTSTMNAVRASESARATRAGGKARGTHRIASHRIASHRIASHRGVECAIRVDRRAWTTRPRRRWTA